MAQGHRCTRVHPIHHVGGKLRLSYSYWLLFIGSKRRSPGTVWRVRSRSSRLLILQESRQGDLPLVDGRGMKTALAGSTARDESPAPFQFRANAQTPQGLHNVRPVDASRKVAGTV